ncbi:ferrochelatase [Lactococcus nasutitermitis]|uniref:Coproporphyrin III ferrochelatase n=1 Tax=Lactococcus nasutitermitis TaxID=1652957 RepID=A0ABV9JDM1_9LACT|nr:ferrochelatase [Lactococcus nasutitermitis]
MIKRKIALLVMSFGSPTNIEDIEAYYTHIRNGRKPTDELLAELKGRFELIGGTSPLVKITEEQGKAIEEVLNDKQDEIEYKLYIGYLHVAPFIKDAVQQIYKDGLTEAVSIVLAPQFSGVSLKLYNDEAQKVATELGIQMKSIESWYQAPKFIEAWADNLKTTLAEIPVEEQNKAVVVFTAHSIPLKSAQSGDLYVPQVKETAKLIAEKAKLTHYEEAWQSAGRTPFPWVGPDVLEFTKKLHYEKGYIHYIYCPVSFVADHLEVLFDNDYECKKLTDKLGVHYHRPEMPNVNPKFIEALAGVVVAKVAEN